MGGTDRSEQPESKRAEEPVAASSRDSQLADAAMALLLCRSENDVFAVACDFMAQLCPGTVIVVDEVGPGEETLITRGIVGLDESMLVKAAKIFGVELVGNEWKIRQESRGEVLSGELTRIPGGIPELAGREIPRSVAEAGAKLFGIHDVFTIGMADRQHALGGITIITREANATLPTHIIESFARHCYSALASIANARELARSAESNRLVLKNMVEGLALHEIILDENGVPYDYRFLSVNPAFEALTGLKAEDIVGRTVLEVLPGTEPTWIERYGAVATTGVPARFESYSNELDKYFGIIAYSPSQGQFVAVISDITERKHAEDTILRTNIELEERVQERTEELTAMNEELTAMNEELLESNALLEEATRAKSEFLASMSHELRTPLNSIIGFTGILLQGLAGPVTAEQRLQLGMVSESGKHLLSLIDDVLDLSKIESGRTDAFLREFEVPPVVESAVDMIRPLADTKGVRLTLNCEPGTELLRSDPRLVSQILINLLGNAVKFTDTGTVSLAVSVEGEQMIFVVADTGRGIRAEDLPHILESFYQAQPFEEAKSQGTGLGLAISSKLAEILGGSIEVSSELGVGSTFTLRIPILVGATAGE